MTPEERLMDMGLPLPEAPRPVATYVPYVQVGELVYISGQLPTREGELVYVGQVGKNVTGGTLLESYTDEDSVTRTVERRFVIDADEANDSDQIYFADIEVT